MRLFIGIDCPQAIRDALSHDAAEAMRYVDMTPVRCENIHLTLKFLGEADSKKMEALVSSLAEINNACFTIAVEGIGVFPSIAKPRVIWAGISDGRMEVESLASGINSVCEKLGFPKEDKFHPHITLGRIKKVKDKGGLKAILEAKKTVKYGSAHVSGYHLIESKLSPGGSKYFKIKDFPLR